MSFRDKSGRAGFMPFAPIAGVRRLCPLPLTEGKIFLLAWITWTKT